MKKFTKPILTLALLMLGLTSVKAGEEKVIIERDYTTTADYPYYWMGDRVDNNPDQPNFCNGTASVQIVDGALEIANTQVQKDGDGNDAAYPLQPFIIDWFNIQEGGYTYKIKIWLKADNDGSANLSVGTWSGSDNIGLEFQASNDFVEYTKELTPEKSFASENNAHVLFQAGLFVGTVWIQKVQIIEVAPDGPVVDPYADWVSIAGDNYVKVYPSTAIEVAVPDGNGVYAVECPVKATNDWDTQFWMGMKQKLAPQKKVRITFEYMSSVDVNAGTQIHEAPGNYVHWGAIGGFDFKADKWNTYAGTYTVPNECDGKKSTMGDYNNDFRSIAFNLSQNVSDEKTGGPVTFYFRNIDFRVAPEDVGEDEPEPQQPEQFIIPERPADYIVLEKGAFQKWDGVGADAIPTNELVNPDWFIDEQGLVTTTGMVAGTSTVDPYIFADLSAFESLMIICGKVDKGDAAAVRAEAVSPEGLSFRVLINRSDERNEAGTDWVQPITLYATSDGQGWAEADITKDAAGAELDYAHLNAIKLNWSQPETRVFALMAKEKPATGIKDINVNEANKGIFDLNGRRVNGVSKGIFIINGQKVVF